MDGIEEKLNKVYPVEIQGGSIIILLKILSTEVARMEVMAELSKASGVDLGVSDRLMAALDAIGNNLMKDAEKIFGRDYLVKVFHGEAGVEPGDIEKMAPGSASIN